LDIEYEVKRMISLLSSHHKRRDENPRIASIGEENQERRKRREVEGGS
jgi:hypothetical protein